MFRNLFGPKFAEYAAFLHTWEDVRNNCKLIIDNDEKAYSKAFNHFVKTQSSNSTPLTTIKENGLAQVKAMQTLFEATKGTSTSLHDLQLMNDKINKTFSELNNLKNAEKKAISAAEAANLNLEKSKLKNAPNEVSKNEQKFAAAQSKSESATKAVEDFQSRYDVETVKYRQEFIQKLLEIISSVVEAKINEINELIPLSQEITAAAAQIQQNEDKANAKLEEALQELEKETIE
ncbi:hypothetical protein M9Y10_027315 [Tritrichomonas musculus]|uniref:Uncharacterized protein n=1 Tax=Tritrichomonas musculus TaxID=1915356 RepID=A0ABR2H6Q0_9EUKA